MTILKRFAQLFSDYLGSI